MNKPYRHFDLPRQHITGANYIPDRARDPEEIERRRSLPTGTLLAEMQHSGLVVAASTLEHVEDPEDVAFVCALLAAAGINSSWYSFARDAPTMRRRLELPDHTSDLETADKPETYLETLEKVRHGLAGAVRLAEELVIARTQQYETRGHSIRLGRRLGEVSLELACVRPDEPRSVDAFEAQVRAREHSLEALEHSRTMVGQLGVHPSIVQLSHPDAPLSVYYRRKATNGSYDAFDKAMTELAA